MKRGLLAVVLVCGGLFLISPVTPAPATAPDCVITIAGDIAGSADPSNDEYVNALRTGDVVRAVSPTFALTAGDNAYDDGSLVELQTKYEPTWGSFKGSTRPTPGNHEYHLPGAQGYFDYFFGGVSVGNEYYGFDCGAWRLYSLNCEIPCAEGSAELAWLRNDLAANPGRHYLGYLHQPRFTSGSNHGPNEQVSALYSAIQSAGGDVLVSAHNHNYERFAKQNANGVIDSQGLRQFIAGTGGAGLYGFGPTQPNSEVRDGEHFGVLKLVLSDASYSWQFLSAGRKQVSGTGVDDPEHPLGTVLDEGSESTNLGFGGNRPPAVSAGADQAVILPAAATLNGSVSDDGLPNPPGGVTSAWTQVSGPADATFADAGAPATTATLPQPGTYVFRLAGSDGELNSSDDVIVQAAPAGTPTVVDVPVATGSDDAEEYGSGSVNLGSSDLELVTDGTPQTVGIRFASVPVPAGATVTAAWLQFQVDEVSTDAASLTIRGVAADSTPTFTTASLNISSRPMTAAQVGWAPVSWPTVGAQGPDQQTPNLFAVVQEILDRPGWVSGNALAVVFTGTGRRTAEAFESGPPPLLHVEYTTGPRPNQAPVVNGGADQTITLPAGAALAGSVSDDGLPDPPGSVTTTWSQTSGPGAAVFDNPSSPVTTVTFPAAGTYVLRLTGDDSALSSYDELSVEALPEGTPPPPPPPTVLDVPVATGSDDAEEGPSGGVNLTSGDLELVTDGTKVQRVGIRFASLAIPRGAAVSRAWVQFTTDEVSTDAAYLAIRGVAADSTPTFTKTTRNISTRPLTTTAVGWTPAPWPTKAAQGPDQRTPDLAAVIQEIVNRSGWSNGNSLALVVEGSGRRTARSFESGPAPVLHVVFSP